MLYSVANLHEIGFIARVPIRADITVDIGFRCVTSSELFFYSAISARTEILNRGTRKCQSRQRHVRLQRVLHWSRQQAGTRDAVKTAKSGKNWTIKKRGRIVSKLSFCWLECHSPTPRSNRVKNGVFYFTRLVVHICQHCFSIYMAHRSLDQDESIELDFTWLFLLIANICHLRLLRKICFNTDTFANISRVNIFCLVNIVYCKITSFNYAIIIWILSHIKH